MVSIKIVIFLEFTQLFSLQSILWTNNVMMKYVQFKSFFIIADKKLT